MSPSENKAKTRVKMSSLYRLLPWLKGHLPLLGIIVVLIVLINLAELVKPYILKIVIDDHLKTGASVGGGNTIIVLGLLYLACVVLGSGFGYLQSLLVTRLGQGMLMQIRREVFRHILHLPMRVLDHYSSGRLITRATNDVETINEFFTDVLVNLIRDVFLLIGIVAMMLAMNWQLALVSFVTIPLIALSTIMVRGRLRRNFVKIKHLIGSINGFFAENIAGMRLIQIFVREKQRQKVLDEINDEYCRSTLTQIRLNSLLRPLMEVINTLGIVFLIWFATRNLNSSLLDIGVLYAFTTYVKQFFEPINDLAEKYSTIQSASVSADRIFELLDKKEDQEDLASGQPLGRIQGRVEFDHVWFAYNEGEWVLKDLSFVLEPGQSAAIVGPTGTGKTTIISLLLRFYDIQRGSIRLDGQDIRTLNIRDLRRQIAIVLQDVFLFSGSIADNIRLGDESINDAQITQALQLAQADEFIDKLDGRMDTPVTERGSTFSAGQRQLLSFARAIARHPALFILDEATAQIDTVTEQQIQHSIAQISANRTTIIIAHRLSTIQRCDVILVLEQGQLEEQGTHDELIARGGHYARMIEAQLGDIIPDKLS
ncbi:MAG TPA: ABC transporter ATP-binding protein [Clostridiales bacterium]|nr:ABC transporter ATP-binding protein [Clostridiales bacterium]